MFPPKVTETRRGSPHALPPVPLTPAQAHAAARCEPLRKAW